jgi:outer membrane murein-binding lipoprotein Lpp
MTFSAPVGTATACGLLLVAAGLLVALCISRLDLDVVRRDLAELAAEREQLTSERDEAYGHVIEIRTAMAKQRANTAGLLARIRHLEAGNAPQPATPVPLAFVVDELMTEIETHLGKKGGERR